jgi:hypothetical protein
MVMPADIFRDSAFGNVDVEVEVAIEVAGQAETVGSRPNVRHRRLRRFLHDVAKLAGQRQLAFAVNYAGFGAQD